MKNKITPEEFIGKAKYDEWGQYVWGVDKAGGKMIANVRAWGAIQNIFGCKVAKSTEAVKFQDELGQFIADAINEKIERSKLK